MPYTLIKGEFHIFYPHDPRNGPEPDGDTLKFRPDQPKLVENLRRTGSPPAFNKAGLINIRFEAIDALETHFEEFHQELTLANAARDFLLKQVGFRNVKFFSDLPNKVQSVNNHPAKGFILASTLDSYGRIIAFVYTQDQEDIFDGQNSEKIWLSSDNMLKSVNAMMIQEGLVYPAFYSTLPVDLIKELSTIVKQTKTLNPPKGLWASATATVDKTAIINDIDDLENLVIWPKLFRRLASFFSGGFKDLRTFNTWLRQDPVHRDDKIQLPNSEIGNMHDLIEVTASNEIKLKYPVEDIIILPDGEPVNPPHKFPEVALKIVTALVNPVGNDLGFEEVTILNITSDDIQDLSKYYISDKNGKKDFLMGSLKRGRAYTHTLTNNVQLPNNGGTIFLFKNTDGGESEKIDQVSYTKEQAQVQGAVLVFNKC